MSHLKLVKTENTTVPARVIKAYTGKTRTDVLKEAIASLQELKTHVNTHGTKNTGEEYIVATVSQAIEAMNNLFQPKV